MRRQTADGGRQSGRQTADGGRQLGRQTADGGGSSAIHRLSSVVPAVVRPLPSAV
jgi:hypothetical protein